MAVVTTNPRVTASDPGAFLDAEAWTFTVTFTDPLTGDPVDLTGSRLFVTFGTQTPVGFIAIQTCDSAADDGSLSIADDTSGQAGGACLSNHAAPYRGDWRPSAASVRHDRPPRDGISVSRSSCRIRTSKAWNTNRCWC